MSLIEQFDDPDLARFRASRPLSELKAAKWDKIAAAWELYLSEDAEAFDWDDESRNLMHQLTQPGPAS